MKAKAYVIHVPLLNRDVTVLVSKDPRDDESHAALAAAYKATGARPKLADVDRGELRETFDDHDTGLCMTEGVFSNRVLVWVYEFRTGVLVHEISHATDAILKSTGIGDNGELRAMLNEFLMREAVNGIRAVK